MKRSSTLKLIAYPFLLASIVFAGLEYSNIITVGAAGACCTYGVDCPEAKGRGPVLRCCFPFQEAPCSPTKANYCRETC